jgi:hypothetical protein
MRVGAVGQRKKDSADLNWPKSNLKPILKKLNALEGTSKLCLLHEPQKNPGTKITVLLLH